MEMDTGLHGIVYHMTGREMYSSLPEHHIYTKYSAVNCRNLNGTRQGDTHMSLTPKEFCTHSSRFSGTGSISLCMSLRTSRSTHRKGTLMLKSSYM